MAKGKYIPAPAIDTCKNAVEAAVSYLKLHPNDVTSRIVVSGVEYAKYLNHWKQNRTFFGYLFGSKIYKRYEAVCQQLTEALQSAIKTRATAQQTSGLESTTNATPANGLEQTTTDIPYDQIQTALHSIGGQPAMCYLVYVSGTRVITPKIKSFVTEEELQRVFDKSEKLVVGWRAFKVVYHPNKENPKEDGVYEVTPLEKRVETPTQPPKPKLSLRKPKPIQ